MSYWIAGATVVSSAGSLFSSNSASKAQKKAQAAQLAFEREKFEAQLEQRRDDISRAFAGQEDEARRSFSRFFDDTEGFRQAGFGGRRVADAINALEPSRDAIIDAINEGIFGGGFLDRQTEAQESVNQARTAGAEAEADALNTATSEAIGAQRTRQGLRGFQGGSTADRNALLRTRARGLGNIARARTTADLENQLGLQNVDNQDIQRVVSNLATPFQFTRNVAAETTLPTQTESNLLVSRLAPLGSFRLNSPIVRPGDVNFQPIVGTGAAVGAATQGVGQALGQIGQQRQLNEQNRLLRESNERIAALNSGATAQPVLIDAGTTISPTAAGAV